MPLDSVMRLVVIVVVLGWLRLVVRLLHFPLLLSFQASSLLIVLLLHLFELLLLPILDLLLLLLRRVGLIQPVALLNLLLFDLLPLSVLFLAQLLHLLFLFLLDLRIDLLHVVVGPCVLRTIAVIPVSAISVVVPLLLILLRLRIHDGAVVVCRRLALDGTRLRASITAVVLRIDGHGPRCRCDAIVRARLRFVGIQRSLLVDADRPSAVGLDRSLLLIE